MKIFIDITDELETAYKTLYIKWFQYLLPYMSIYKITDGKTANNSDVIILSIEKYTSIYHKNPKFNMKKYILIDQQDASSADAHKFLKNENILYIVKPHSLNPPSLNNKQLVRGRYHLNLLNEIYKNVPLDSTDVTQTDYGNYTDKIKCIIPHWFRYQELFNKTIKPLNKRTVDVFFSGTIQYHNKKTLSSPQGELAGSLVTQHRLDCIKAVNNLSCQSYASTKKFKYNDYINYVENCKIFVSPYGNGEFSHKDYEVTLLGCILIKPLSNNIVSYPNIYEDGVTCISCKLDYSDLEEKVNYLLNNPRKMNEINNNVKKRIELFKSNKQCAKDFYELLQSHII